MFLGTSNGHGEYTISSQHATQHIQSYLLQRPLALKNFTLLEWAESLNSAV
jgi:hypothetical protein